MPKKETGLLLQISQDGSSIRVIHREIDKKKATKEIKVMAKSGIDAKYFPEKTVGEFENAMDRLNESLKRHRQRPVKVVPKVA